MFVCRCMRVFVGVGMCISMYACVYLLEYPCRFVNERVCGCRFVCV